MEMTAKERVRCAMELKKPDRVPVFPVITYMHASRIPGIRINQIEKNQDLIYDCLLAAWREYGFDGFEVPPQKPRGWADELTVQTFDGSEYFVRRDGSRIARIQEDDALVYQPAEEPLIRDESDLEKIVLTKSEDYIQSGQMDGVHRVLKAVGENAFISGHAPGMTMNSLVALRGTNNALMDLYDNQRLVHAIFQRVTDNLIELGKAYIELGVDAIYIGDAWCASDIISPAHFAEFCVGQYRRAAELFHRLGVKVYLHICGNSSPILELMASTGVDAIEPLDPLGGVRLEDAKQRVGRKVCLKGGINTLTLLRGSPEDVENETRACLENAGAGGGYLFGTGDDIPRDAPVANVKKMVETVHRYGKYNKR